MTPADLADLAESLVPVAAQLVGAVHDDGPGEVGRILSAVDPGHLPGLAVVLAAMVDPDASAAELLAWVTWDDSPPPREATLFGATFGDYVPSARPASLDPREWSDDYCRSLHVAWRKRQRGTGDPLGTPRIEQMGHREWDRRRKADARARQHPSTRVS
ncbi:MAG TPA: hypothetical protein VIU37_09955 [Candidatus Limnocylindrales bacterium]